MKRTSIAVVLGLFGLAFYSLAFHQTNVSAEPPSVPASSPAPQLTTQPAMPKELTLDLGKNVTMKVALIPAGKLYPSGQTQVRSLSQRIADLEANPQNWQRTWAGAEPATARSPRGGISIESTYQNTLTGETINVHDVYRPSGNQIPNHPTFLDYGKGGQ